MKFHIPSIDYDGWNEKCSFSKAASDYGGVMRKRKPLLSKNPRNNEEINNNISNVTGGIKGEDIKLIRKVNTNITGLNKGVDVGEWFIFS